MTDLSTTPHMPVLPLRDIVVFPHMIVPLFVGREKSVRALETVMSENKQILLLTQTDAAIEDPSAEDMFTMGTIGNILQMLKLPDGTVKVLVEGIDRVKIIECKNEKEYLTSNTEIVKDKTKVDFVIDTILNFDWRNYKKHQSAPSLSKNDIYRQFVEEIIIDAGAVKGQNDPLIIHSKEAKSKTEKTSAA